MSVKVLFSGASQMGQSLNIWAANRVQEIGGSGLTMENTSSHMPPNYK